MKKIYHVCASRSGAMGASPTLGRLPNRFTNRKDAESLRRTLARSPAPRTVYFIEWEWDHD